MMNGILITDEVRRDDSSYNELLSINSSGSKQNHNHCQFSASYIEKSSQQCFASKTNHLPITFPIPNKLEALYKIVFQTSFKSNIF